MNSAFFKACQRATHTLSPVAGSERLTFRGYALNNNGSFRIVLVGLVRFVSIFSFRFCHSNHRIKSVCLVL